MTQRITRAQFIYESLTQDIVQGRLAPGETLDETRLAAAFAVSRTPVREALRKLETTGFAVSRPHRGTVVASISSRRLDEMFVVMADLEALCAHWAALNMSPQERQMLEAHQRSAEPLVREGDAEAYRLSNNAFHEAIYRGAHNEFLQELTLGVRAKVAPYRRAQFETAGRLAGSHAEHGKVVRAILQGDARAAADAMRIHIAVVRERVEDVTQAAPPSPPASTEAGPAEAARPGP